MTKEELKNDMEFRHICSEFGTDYWNDDFEIYDNVIKLNTTNKRVYTLIDEHYNVIGVYKEEKQTKEELTDKIGKIYKMYCSDTDEDKEEIQFKKDQYSK